MARKVKETPFVLLPYQQRWIGDESPVKVMEKSRRIGISWAEAADSALKASTAGVGGMDTWYIAANESGAIEFMNDVAFWAKQLNVVADTMSSVVIEDENKDILAYQVRFATGYRVTGLTSRPTNLRGKQGKVVLDEFAFHPDPFGLMKAAIALLMWGGQVSVISTHDGVHNPFNYLVQECRSGKKNYSLHKVTLDDAIKEGLYKRICLSRGRNYTIKAEQVWRSSLIDHYGEDADEELFCHPRAGGGAYLPPLLVEARARKNYSVIRLDLPDEFNTLKEVERITQIKNWLYSNVRPKLAGLPKGRGVRSYFGMDFGRVADLTAIAIGIEQESGDASWKRECPILVELRNTPIRQQEQILYYLVDHLLENTGFRYGAMDARGNGMAIAEFTEQRYGSCIERVMASDKWYLEAMPKYKAALEDNILLIPADDEVLADHTVIREENGVPKVPQGKKIVSLKREAGEKRKTRHGDAAIALVLMNWAIEQKGDRRRQHREVPVELGRFNKPYFQEPTFGATLSNKAIKEIWN